MVAQHALHQLSPETALLWRGFFAALGAALWLLWHRHWSWLLSALTLRERLLLLLLGALGVPLNQWCFFAGVHWTAAANASLMYALTPVWALLLSWGLRQERLNLRKIFGIGCAFAGVVAVLSEREFAFGAEHVQGNLLLLCASVAWAGFTVLSQPLSLQHGALPVTASSMLVGWLLYVPFWALLDGSLGWDRMTPIVWGELLYMGVVTSGIGYLLWLVALRHMEASKVAIFSTLQPVLTILASLPLFGFVPSLAFLFGTLLVIAGVVLTHTG
ncbi:MAG: EamA family transporter [Chlorobiota bacterium]